MSRAILNIARHKIVFCSEGNLIIGSDVLSYHKVDLAFVTEVYPPGLYRVGVNAKSIFTQNQNSYMSTFNTLCMASTSACFFASASGSHPTCQVRMQPAVKACAAPGMPIQYRILRALLCICLCAGLRENLGLLA